MKQFFQKKVTRILFIALVLTIIQFFYVQTEYVLIEIYEVYFITFLIATPAIIGLNYFFLHQVTLELFYGGDNELYEATRFWDKIKNKLAIFGLISLITGFFIYGFIINTNDWFGQNKYQEIETEILNSEKRNAGRRGRSGMSRWYILVEIENKEYTMRSKTAMYVGDTLRTPLNFGGAWGILYR
ncbi:MAG: hypothetical protein ACFHU9_06300 [Fluviicola sp.]